MADPLAAARERGENSVNQLIRDGLIVPSRDQFDILIVNVEGKRYALPQEVVSLDGFPQVVNALKFNNLDDWACINFFLNPSDYLAGTPVEALKRGEFEKVIEYALDYLGHGA